MDVYKEAKAFKLPSAKAKCPYCATDYMHADSAYSICPLCESIINADGKAITDSDSTAKLNVISASISKNAILEASENADILSLNGNPQVLYALASSFKSLSDFTYWDVDYTLKAFMEHNADNRNDEVLRNKYSAMHLYSKYRECLYKAIEIIALSKAADEPSVYINAMAETKMHRFAHASTALANLKDAKSPAFIHASMALYTEAKDKRAEASIMRALKAQDQSAIFYAAKHLAFKKEFSKASSLLAILSSFTDLPKYRTFGRKITMVSSAVGI